MNEAGTIPDISPWIFFNQNKESADGWMLAVQRLYPTRMIVPFALWVGSDDIACFAGDDHSGDPLVHYVHVYASPGWEDRGSVANFTEWLKAAEKQSADFKAESDE